MIDVMLQSVVRAINISRFFLISIIVPTLNKINLFAYLLNFYMKNNKEKKMEEY